MADGRRRRTQRAALDQQAGQPAHAAEGRAGARRRRHGRTGGPVLVGRRLHRPGPGTGAPSNLPSLSDIRHVVFLMQENRSFDHYFGTLSGVRGFSDPKVLTNRIGGSARPRLGPVRLPARCRRRPHGLPPAVRPAAAVPDRQRRLHQRHLARMGTAAPELGRREDGRLRPGAPGGRRRRQLRRDHGLLRPVRAPLLLRAGRRLHHLRRLPLLGARAHRPQSRHGPVGHHRPRRRRRRSGPRDPDHRPARSSTGSSRGPPCPSSCSMPA